MTANYTRNHRSEITTFPSGRHRLVKRNGWSSLQRKETEQTDRGPVSRWIAMKRWQT